MGRSYDLHGTWFHLRGTWKFLRPVQESPRPDAEAAGGGRTARGRIKKTPGWRRGRAGREFMNLERDAPCSGSGKAAGRSAEAYCLLTLKERTHWPSFSTVTM